MGKRIDKWKLTPTKVTAWNKSGSQITAEFVGPKHGRYGRAYWRLFAAFNPGLPGAEKVEDSEIGALLIDLISTKQVGLKDDLISIVTGNPE